RKSMLMGAVILLTGCSSIYEPQLKSTSLGKEVVLSSTGSIGTTIVQDPNNLKKVCLGRGVEAAFEQSDTGSISVSLVSIGKSDAEGASNAEKAGEEEMTGRTPAVLITRELFYRACELSINSNLDKKEALEVFYKVLNVVDNGWKQEGANTRVTFGDTVSVQSTNKDDLTGAQPSKLPVAPIPAPVQTVAGQKPVQPGAGQKPVQPGAGLNPAQSGGAPNPACDATSPYYDPSRC
ncbi:MAG: hypothetical protein VW521_13115, partial [Rhodospirillales bacterium]